MVRSGSRGASALSRARKWTFAATLALGACTSAPHDGARPGGDAAIGSAAGRGRDSGPFSSDGGHAGAAGSSGGSSASGGRSSGAGGGGGATAGVAGGAGRASSTPDAGGIPAPNRTVTEPTLHVVPWDGHRGAVSLTFDDGYASAVDAAGPALDRRGLKGTFFVICANIGSLPGFQALGASGHEIANHTMNHLGASDGSATVAQITDCAAFIQKNFGKAPVTFAYPLTDLGAKYRDVVTATYVAGRGGGGAFIPLAGNPDWTNVVSIFAGTGPVLADWKKGVDDAVAAGGWQVFTFHSILPENYYAGVSPEDLGSLLDHLVTKGDAVWVDTFAHVAGYFRAQKLLEAAAKTGSAGTTKWTWSLPGGFPGSVVLRVVIDGGHLSQKGVPLAWDSREGYYPVDLGQQELSWSP